MIPCKRALGWALCLLVGAAAAFADPAGEEGLATDAPSIAEESVSAPEAPPMPEPSEAEAPVADAAAPDPEADALADEGADVSEAEDALAETAPDAAGLEPLPAADSDLAVPAEVAPTEDALAAPPQGVVGYDSEGRQGRIHVVVPGDTLWDISETYLGTPWVWPSIWNDNGEIENPHRIYPGDRIWITPTEMRRISAAEANRLIANTPQEEVVPAEEPAAPAEPAPVPKTTLESALPAPSEAGSYRVSARETAGLITPEKLTSAASVVGRVPDRYYLSQEDQIYIGLGESEVEVGDEFTLFRTNHKVFDPDTGQLLGYHVDFLGRARVERTFPESSLATIRMSTGEVEVGDRVMPREPLPAEIPIQVAPIGVEGKISFFPQRRVLMGFQDFVYLNRGTLDGLEIGSPLEVYRPSYLAEESARAEDVEVPSRVVAKLLVVRAEADSSVAVVTFSDTELELGDRFRGATE